MYLFLFSAVKQLIAINCIQNKSFCLHNICVCAVYSYYVSINTHSYSIYLENIYMYLYVYIYIIFLTFIHAYVCIYLHKYTQHTHILCKQKTFILDAINRD